MTQFQIFWREKKKQDSWKKSVKITSRAKNESQSSEQLEQCADYIEQVCRASGVCSHTHIYTDVNVYIYIQCSNCVRASEKRGATARYTSLLARQQQRLAYRFPANGKRIFNLKRRARAATCGCLLSWCSFSFAPLSLSLTWRIYTVCRARGWCGVSETIFFFLFLMST